MVIRQGFALLEFLVAGVLLLIVAQTGWWVVAVHARVGLGIVEGSRALDAARVSRHVVANELRESGSPDDFATAGGELRLRAFRGVGVVCDGGNDVWWVNVAGHRRLNATKDSVLVFDTGVGWDAVRVRHAAADSGRCPVVAGFREERWTFDRGLGAPVIGKYFERGGYRFTDGAFRTFVGRGGWQPITEDRLDSNRSHLEAIGRRGVWATFVWAAPGASVDSVSWVSWGLW